MVVFQIQVVQCPLSLLAATKIASKRVHPDSFQYCFLQTVTSQAKYIAVNQLTGATGTPLLKT